jgi:hypothetical protein
MADFTDFTAGLENANDYLDARHNISGTFASGNDALRVVSSAQYSFTLRELLCGVLSGNGFKLPNIQICLHANIQALLGIPNLQAELRDALQQLDGAFQEFMDHTTLDSILGRLNGILAEAQNVANMINFCSAPVDPIAIPNMLERAFGSFLGAGMDLIDQIGSIAPGEVCACIGTGGFNSNVFDGGILGNIANNIDAINAGNLSQSVIDSIRNDVESVTSGIRNLVNSENNINGAYDLGGSQFATPDPGCNPNVGVMHNPNTGSIASNARLTSSLKALYDNLAGYPVIANDGTEYPNIFHLLLDPEMLDLLDRTDDPQSDVTNQIPVLDYCGNIIGYTTNYVQQEPQKSDGSDPSVPNSPGYHAGGLITDSGNNTDDTQTVQNTTVQYTFESGGGSTVYIVNSEAAQLALQTNTHDIVVRSDILTTFVRKDTATFDTGTITDYQQASVTFTVFGKNVNELSGNGFVIKDGDGAVARIITGQANQIEVLNGDGRGGNPIIRIANNPVLPGEGAVTIPKGDTTARPSAEAGKVRYNNDIKRYEAYYDDSNQWRSFATSNDLLNQTFTIKNIGTGVEVHKQLNISNEHELRKINTSGLLTIAQNTDDITIGDDLTLSNVGTGAGVFKQRSTNNFQLKSITTATSGNITITNNADTIDISGDPRIKYATLTTLADGSFNTVQFEGNIAQPAVGKTWMFTVHALAGDPATTRRGWKLEGMVQNVGGTPTLIGSVARTDYQRQTPDYNVTAWTPITNYNIGDIIEHDLILYRAINNISSSSGAAYYTSPDQNSTPPGNDWEVEYTGWNVAARVVGSDFVIQVKGDTLTTVNWSMKLEFIEI